MTDDTISRQAAIDALLHNQETYSNSFDKDPLDRYAIAIIDNDAQTIAQLPPAQPERKRGKWVFIGGYGFHCSFFSYIFRCTACNNCANHETKYCPNCGAEMEDTP